MIFTADFPSDAQVPQFPFDFGLFPEEQHQFPSRGYVSPAAASSTSAPQLPVPGPSSQPIPLESTFVSGPVITADDYQYDSDSDAPLIERPLTPPTRRKGKGRSKGKGRGKGRGKGKGKARESDADSDTDSSPERAPASPTSAAPHRLTSSSSGTPRSPPVSTPRSSPSVSPQSSPSPFRIHTSYPPNHRGPARYSAPRRPHRRFSSEISSRPHRRRIRGHHPLDEIRRLIGQALAVVPRTMETL